MLEEYATLSGAARELGLAEILLSILASFVLSQVLAWVYVKTYQGLSYSRSFVHALVLGSLVTCILILAIGNNLARGLGILGTLAIIRFRTQVRDPRDIIFLFGALAVGIATGAAIYPVALAGTFSFALVAVYLHYSPFASLRSYEGLVRFLAPAKNERLEAKLGELFTRYCAAVQLVALREALQGESLEYAYQVRLVDPSYQAELLQGLRGIEGLEEPSLLMHRATVEL